MSQNRLFVRDVRYGGSRGVSKTAIGESEFERGTNFYEVKFFYPDFSPKTFYPLKYCFSHKSMI